MRVGMSGGITGTSLGRQRFAGVARQAREVPAREGLARRRGYFSQPRLRKYSIGTTALAIIRQRA